MSKTPKQIVDAVRRGGVIGAGGGGFPAYVKLQAKVDTVIANGSECEPLLATDKTLMKERPDLIVEGMQFAMTATGASSGVIAVKEHYTDVVKALTAALPSDKSIKLHLLENYYPAGDEFLLVCDVTGRVIPEGGIPLNVGVVVSNVLSLAQMAQAVNGKPVTERPVTVTGEVNEPKVVTVPIGTTYRDILKMAGGLKVPDAVIIDGGPMMGKIVENLEAGIAKTTSGVLALPPDHFIVRMGKKPLSQIIKQSKSACCQCFRCSDLCPRNLLGHELYPHMTMRTIDYNQAEPKQHITSAFLCSQCGMCELIACDFMLLSPRRILGAYRKELAERGVKNPHTRSKLQALPSYNDRKVSISTILKKTGLTEYLFKLPYEGLQTVEKVRIPLTRHTGAPSIPSVKLKQKVRMGDVIAATPEDKLGTVYHASIAGEVTEVTNYLIEIRK